MRKYHDVLQEDTPRRRRSRAPKLIGLVLVALAGPLIYEVVLTLFAGWQSLLGSYRPPETPIMSAISEWVRASRQDFRMMTAPLLSGGAWRSKTAVPMAIGWALLMAVVFLRKVR